MVSVAQFDEQLLAVNVAQALTSKMLSAQLDAEQSVARATAIRNLRIRILLPNSDETNRIALGMTHETIVLDSKTGRKDPDLLSGFCV